MGFARKVISLWFDPKALLISSSIFKFLDTASFIIVVVFSHSYFASTVLLGICKVIAKCLYVSVISLQMFSRSSNVKKSGLIFIYLFFYGFTAVVNFKKKIIFS